MLHVTGERDVGWGKGEGPRLARVLRWNISGPERQRDPTRKGKTTEKRKQSPAFLPDMSNWTTGWNRCKNQASKIRPVRRGSFGSSNGQDGETRKDVRKEEKEN